MSAFKLGQLIPLVQQEASRQGVDPSLAIAILFAENTADGEINGVNMNKMVSLATQSPKGALGIMQVMPKTLEGLKNTGFIPKELDYGTLEGQITAGVAALRDIVGRTKGDPFLTAAAYNGGSAGIAGVQGAAPLPTETEGYLQKIGKSLGISFSRKSVPADKQAALNQATGSFQTTLDTNLPKLRSLQDELTGATQRAGDAAKSKADAEVAGVRAAADREVEKVNKQNQLLADFGIGSQNADTQAQIQKIDAMDKAIAALEPQIQADMATSPFENPIAWLGSQIRLMKTVPQHTALSQSRQTAISAIATKQQLVANQAALEPAVTADTIRQEMYAKQELARATAALNLEQMKREDINARARLLSEELSWKAQLTGIRVQDARLYMEHLGIQRDEQANAANQKLLDNVNKNLVELGGVPIPTWDQFKALSGKQRDLMLSLGNISTPGEKIAAIIELGTIRRLQNTPGTSAMGYQIDFLVKSATPEYDRIKMLPENKDRSEAEIMGKAVDKTVNKWREQLNPEIQTYDKLPKDNPYRMQPKEYAKAAGLETNAIAKFVRENGKDMEVDEKIIMQHAIAQISNGKPVGQVAMEVEEFARKGFEHQWKSTGMGTLGFDPKNPKWKEVGYTVDGEMLTSDPFIIGALKGKQRRDVNLFNRSSIENFLTINAAELARRKAFDDAQNRRMFDLQNNQQPRDPRGGIQQPVQRTSS